MTVKRQDERSCLAKDAVVRITAGLSLMLAFGVSSRDPLVPPARLDQVRAKILCD
jgi:hypothetical protein